MFWTLFVKPILLAALALVIWIVWRAGDHFEPPARRRHRWMVGIGATLITALVLGPPAWAALRDHPADVAFWALGLGLAALAIWGYVRLLAAARRRAGGDHR